MADSKKKQTKVYLIPESESRDSHTYHYLAVKTKKLVIENQKLRIIISHTTFHLGFHH